MVLDEPEGDSEMAALGRFVVLKHDWPEPHRDLIFEPRNVTGAERLPTWALYPERTDEDFFPTDRTLAGRAVPLEPHRRAYLDYEGPVSGERGSVERECQGFVIDSESDASGDLMRIELAMIGPGGEFRPGDLSIERNPGNDIVRVISVGRNHTESAASGHVFEWRPKRAGRSSEEGSVA